MTGSEGAEANGDAGAGAGKVANRHVLVNPLGQITAQYDKVNPLLTLL